ncbi:MAG: glycosyltransferase [Thermoleophilia bacterium]|nr:glycosyltransferase [Thermoleophilia bacterium]
MSNAPSHKLTDSDSATDEPLVDGRPLRVVVASMWPSARTPEYGIFVRRHVQALRRAGVDVTVAKLTESRSGRLRVATKYLSLMLRTAYATRRTKPDLIVAHYLNPTGDVSRMAATLTGTPFVVVAHGTDVRNSLARPDGKYAQRTRSIVRSARAVLAVSQPLADDLKRLVPEVDVAICDMGIDTHSFVPAATPAPAPRDDETLRLLAVGSLTPDKNHAALIRAVAQSSDTNLVIVGEGATRPALELLIDELGLRNRVALAGRIPPAELSTWYPRFHGACLPSLREGFGLSALEALACGCPVLVSSAAPVSGLVKDGVTGAVVDATDVDDIARGITRMRSLGQLDAAQVRTITAGRTVDEQAQKMAALLVQAATSQDN